MFLEDYKQFVGIFWGIVSIDVVDFIVYWVDVFLCVGIVFIDYSIVGWIVMFDIFFMVVEMDYVIFFGVYFSCVCFGEFFFYLVMIVKFNNFIMIEYNCFKFDLVFVCMVILSDEFICKEILR